MNKKKPILTLLLSLFLFTMVMTTGVGATVATHNVTARDLTSGSITTSNVATASTSNDTLYYDSSNGKMYTYVNQDGSNATLYSGQSDQWSAAYSSATGNYILTLKGFNFTTSKEYALILMYDTTICLADHTSNTLISTFSGENNSSGLATHNNLTIYSDGTGTGNLYAKGGTSTGSEKYSDGIFCGATLTVFSGQVMACGGADNESSGIDTYTFQFYSGDVVASGRGYSLYFISDDAHQMISFLNGTIFIGGAGAQDSGPLNVTSGSTNDTLFDAYPYLHVYSVLTDIAYNSWYYQNISYMYNAGYIKGYPNSDGLSYAVHPNSTITRAEFVAILARLYYSEAELNQFAGNYTFNDVPGWASKYVGWATKSGFVQGYDNTTFGAGDNISREQMASILDRIVTQKNLTSSVTKAAITFTDANDIATYAKNAVTNMQKAGVINGYSNGDGTYSFNPKGQATRAEAITMIKNFLVAYK